jgi:hypothetical protein
MVLGLDARRTSPERHEASRGPPDYGTLWSNRLRMIGLKIEKTSHRPTQLPAYFQLAAHLPSHRIDPTHLTPTMPLVAPWIPAGIRSAHLN